MKSPALSRQAKIRLSWMTHYAKFKNARLTCRHFAISPDTFYTWKRRFNPADPLSLERPIARKTIRQGKKWNYQTLLLLRRVLEQHPRISLKDMQDFLIRQNIKVSLPTTSRLIKRVKKTSPLSTELYFLGKK